MGSRSHPFAPLGATLRPTPPPVNTTRHHRAPRAHLAAKRMNRLGSARVAIIWFVPIRPGEYKFWADGYEDRGLAGTFVVN